jgi:hypothetical protein
MTQQSTGSGQHSSMLAGNTRGNVSKSSLDQNNQYSFQQTAPNTQEVRKSGKNNKLRHSQNADPRNRQQFYPKNQGPQTSQNIVQQSVDMVQFKNGTSPSTSMNFFKGNNTQQIGPKNTGP